MSPATKPEEEVTPETAVPKRTVEEDVKSSVKRELFPTTFKEDGESALPEEVSQASNDKWVEANGAKGLIKLRGEGRTAEVVRSEMQLYALGMTTATSKAAAAAEVAVEAALAPLLVTPEEKQAALDAWVKENADDERGGLLKLRGEGRTAEKLAAEVGLVAAGAKYVKNGNVPKEGAARKARSVVRMYLCVCVIRLLVLSSGPASHGSAVCGVHELYSCTVSRRPAANVTDSSFPPLTPWLTQKWARRRV